MVLKAFGGREYGYIRRLHDFCRTRGILQETARFEIGSGATTAVFLLPPDRCRTVALFCHGLGADRYYPFTEMFIDLLQANYGIFSVDLDGHGIGNDHIFSFPEVLDTIPMSVAFIQKNYGTPPGQIVLFGHSLGGVLCLHAAGRAKYGGVITVSSPCRIEVGMRAVGELLAVFAPGVLRQLRYYSLWELLPAFRGFKRSQFPCRTPGGLRSCLKDVNAVLERISLLQAIRPARTPLLQIHGRLDQAVPFSQALEIHRQYGGVKELVCLPYDTHLSAIFSNRCRTSILRWMNEIIGTE